MKSLLDHYFPRDMMKGTSSAKKIYGNGTDMREIIREKILSLMATIKVKREDLASSQKIREEMSLVFRENGYSSRVWNPRNGVFYDFDTSFRNYHQAGGEVYTLSIDIQNDEGYLKELRMIYEDHKRYSMIKKGQF